MTATWLDPPLSSVRDVVARALAEDLGVFGDLTAGLLPPGATVAASIVARERGILAGRLAASETFAAVDPAVTVRWEIAEGEQLDAGLVLARVDGPLASVVTGERTALNLLGHLSGIASLTRRYVDAAGGRARIRDTRKTTPGLRALEKAAVRAGGGVNHRGSLSDGILVKDNHLAGLSIEAAVSAAHQRWPGVPCQVECDSLDQVKEALVAGADLVLLDNMDLAAVAAAVAVVGGRVPVEVSGRVALEDVAGYVQAGADLISVGSLTHSAPVLDIGLDLGVLIPMLVAIDVGNTQTVIGLFGPGDGPGGSSSELLYHWRIATVASRTADEMALLLDQLFQLQGLDPEEAISGIAVASVVPRQRTALREMTHKWFKAETVIVEPGVRTGMPIHYDNPKEVGADRIADAVAAYDRYGGPTIVVDFGTATTFEVVSERGEYLGGVIIPGIEISLEALFNRAALLPRVELVEPRTVLAKNTVESVQSGIIFGFAAQVDGLCRRLEDEVGPCTVVATGGLAELIGPHSAAIEHHEPWLTLQGLRIIFGRNER